ncbi:hypothetical protein ACFLXU_03305 [Chloroflexota bacterium]
MGKYPRKTMKCKFCGNESPLINAHIIPAGFFRRIKDGVEPLEITTNTAGEYTQKSQVGEYDPAIICRKCEAIWQEWDNYIQQLLAEEPLDIGCQLEVSPGYVTSQGNEFSSGQTFILESCEYTSSGGKASLFLYSWDGWREINNWRARHQFRWNKDSSEMSVKDILAFVLARVGLKLEVKSQSSVITGYYPDFTIHPDNRGDVVIRRLLSFVPDMLFIEGNKAYVVNPQSSDSSVYSYGQSHSVLEGRYQKNAWGLNRVQVEGYDPVEDERIVKDTFSWNQIDRLYDRLNQLEDRNIDTVAKVEQRGEAYLREAEIESGGGAIRIPVNCGQQLYDVIDITDSRAGLSAEKKRVLGLNLIYNPGRGEYEQRLSLGAV